MKEVKDMFKQGFVPLDRLLKPVPNFNRGRRIKIFLNLKKLKKTEASNVISGISFPPGFFELKREKFDILLLGRFSIFSDYRLRKIFHFKYYLRMLYHD